MKNAIPINKKLFDIYLLFTRVPFVRYFTKELEFYRNGNGRLLGLISFDKIDNDFYGCILSRDEAKQYRAISVKASIPTIAEARKWIDEKMIADSITFHDNRYKFFDVFRDSKNKQQLHPNYKLLSELVRFSSAKEVIKEISYHYKDIDGNFIEQFQSLNGFDSRIWELYLFCFFREQYFSFKRNYNAPDYIIDKYNQEIAVEAVIVSRKTGIDSQGEISIEEKHTKLKNEIPLLYGSALYDKMKRKYWEKEHVKDIPFLIAIADFHDTRSMTWSSTALIEYLYGYTYKHTFDENGYLIVIPVKVESYVKENGTEIPSGFFFQPGSENISAIIFSSCGTLSKFNRMGKQAGLGSERVTLIKEGVYYDHTPNAAEPILLVERVDENSSETWSEGVSVFHNPLAIKPLNPNLFDDKVAQMFFRIEDKQTESFMPKVFPYSIVTRNLSSQKVK